MTSHDRLFKELLTTFFREFAAEFLPELSRLLGGRTHKFLDKETFPDRMQASDVAVVFSGRSGTFIVLLEIQSQRGRKIRKRLFVYFARLHDRYGFPVYPVLLYTAAKPLAQQLNSYEPGAVDSDVITFKYKLVQLNRLDWRHYLKRDNPAVAALMSKMYIADGERQTVKLECMLMIARLRLSEANQICSLVLLMRTWT